MPTLSAPALDGQNLDAPDFTQAQYLYAPALDGQVVRAPTLSIGTATVGLVVKAADGTVLDSFGRSFIDELGDAGSFSLAMENDDPDLPAFDDVLFFEVDGVLRFSGPVRGKQATVLSEGEEVDEVTALSGPGALAQTDKSLIAPSRGWDALPVETTRSQSWVATDYAWHASWPHAKRIRSADTPTPYFPRRSLPEWYPDSAAWWVAPNRSDITGADAPLGDWPIRSDPITLTAGTYELVFAVNNLGQVYWDGALIADLSNAPTDGNRVQLDVTSGDHTIAARVQNFIRDTGFIGSIYSVDDDGLLDALVWSSDASNMRALPYPAAFPGINFGVASRQALEEIHAEGELLDLTLDYNDLTDSAGQPWSITAEITTDVGRSFYEYLTAAADWLVDLHMAPGGNVLRAWNWGTRGGASGATIATSTSSARASEADRLTFSGLHVRGNHARIRYAFGYTEVDLSGSDPTVTVYIDLSHIRSEATAIDIATRLLTDRATPSWAGTLGFDPAIDASGAVIGAAPFDDFDNGDTITHSADPNGTTVSRVRSISYSEVEENQDTLWVLELNDVRMGEEERRENWLRRAEMGQLAGGAKVTSKRGDSIPAVQKVSSKDVAEFSFQSPTDGALTAKRPASQSGNLVEIHVEVSTAGDIATSSDTQVRVWQNGSSLGTFTVPAGDTSADLDLEASKVYRNVDTFRAEVVTVGGNVNGVDVQVRAI